MLPLGETKNDNMLKGVTLKAFSQQISQKAMRVFLRLPGFLPLQSDLF